jgi:hypothetical protein
MSSIQTCLLEPSNERLAAHTLFRLDGKPRLACVSSRGTSSSCLELATDVNQSLFAVVPCRSNARHAPTATDSFWDSFRYSLYGRARRELPRL